MARPFRARALVGRGREIPGLAARDAERRGGAHRSPATLAKARDRYVYYPGGADVPESVAPDIRGRSDTIAAEVDVDSTEAGGVLFSQGSRFGGHALYVRDGKLKYVYNFLGELVQTVESEERIPTGRVVLSTSFERAAATGCHPRERSPSTSGIKRPVRPRSEPSPARAGLVVGRSGAEQVSDDYAGEPPWPFVGATVKRVLIDVSGEPFADLAREAAALLARQ